MKKLLFIIAAIVAGVFLKGCDCNPAIRTDCPGETTQPIDNQRTNGSQPPVTSGQK
jgi:hypothetical protein